MNITVFDIADLFLHATKVRIYVWELQKTYLFEAEELPIEFQNCIVQSIDDPANESTPNYLCINVNADDWDDLDEIKKKFSSYEV